MAVHLTTALERLEEAVDKARHARHHPDCRCGIYRHGGSPYCSTDEFRYSSMVDRLNQRCPAGVLT